MTSGVILKHHKWRPSIGLMMLALVLIPVAGIGWFAADLVLDTSQNRRAVAATESSLNHFVDVLELGSQLANEKHWAYATSALDSVDIPRSMVEPLVGLDPWTSRQAAREGVDAAAHRVGSPEIIEQLGWLREQTLDPLAANRAYTRIEEEIHAWRLAEAQRLATLPNSTELTQAVNTLQLAAELRDSLALQVTSFFSLRFSSALPSPEAMRTLIASTDRYQLKTEKLDLSAASGSRAAQGRAALQASAHQRRFAAAVAETIGRTLNEGPDLAPTGDQVDLLSEATELAQVFSAAAGANQDHMALVRAAADDVLDLAQQMDAAAAADTRNAVITGLALAALSVWAAVLVGRAIVAPLRRVSQVADAIREGSLDERVPESGPRELGSAGRAINEAVAQLQLSEHQARALARGDLDNPVLATEAPGALGRSLQEAVSQLTSSLAEREEFRRRLSFAAAHDALTGLPNRTASMSHLNRALARTSRTGHMLAVLFVDLDGFKQINEIHGHAAGDRLLTEVAQRLAAAVRQSDMVGRLGDDEFVVVAEPVRDHEEARTLAERLVAEVGQELVIAGVPVSGDASIGITTSKGECSPGSLIREADAAVTAAKRQGRRQIRFCDDDLRTTLATRNSVERGLAAAIEHDHLVLHYQTLVDATTKQPVSIEALVRWLDPDRGLIPPNEFIPVAEASDLIISLDRWVLARAAAQLAEWTDHPDFRDLTLAVNVSERHLGHPHLLDHILGPLRAHDVDPRRLVVEVTESALLDDLATAAAQLATLRSNGIRVAIDDFGTGYTSLAHLRALPIDVLKIDRSFVANLHDPDDLSLIRMIIEIGHLFGLEVIAEGVETADEARELRQLGVNTLQGFRYSRPQPAEELSASELMGTHH